ncbi:MAG TPA: trypsin-like peptidase domain-containing protein [Acidimicrobiales bacterium]|nr:trypsin-like peptidase domain-containing protein [Acidimicrobiales bacterium]
MDRDIVDIDTRLAYQHAIAAGTGMILTSNGIVLTNNHVIDGATTIGAVSVANGRSYPATVLGVDPTADVALIQLQCASNLPTVAISSQSPNPGDPVVALGNAGGSGGTPSVTSGTVVALDQSIIAADPGEGTSEQLNGLIETTAGLQPGDSGGPLVGGTGQIIGMDTAASQPNQTSASVSFAIPIQDAMAVVQQIEAGRASDTVYLGLPAFLGVSASTGTGPEGQVGALVSQTVSSGPAALAGITAGDLIVAVGGTSIDSTEALSMALRRYRPGNTVVVSWIDRFGASHHASVTLAVGPAD